MVTCSVNDIHRQFRVAVLTLPLVLVTWILWALSFWLYWGTNSFLFQPETQADNNFIPIGFVMMFHVIGSPLFSLIPCAISDLHPKFTASISSAACWILLISSGVVAYVM